MPSPQAATRIVARLFRADGDHITDVKVPAFNRPAEIVLWHFRVFQCESASNLDPTPVEHQIVEAEAELSISGVFDRRSIVTPSFFSKTF
jgi:hypothetical protein